jgi:hypothetical protein
MEAICSSKTYVNLQRTTRRYIPGVSTLLKKGPLKYQRETLVVMKPILDRIYSTLSLIYRNRYISICILTAGVRIPRLEQEIYLLFTASRPALRFHPASFSVDTQCSFSRM